MPSTQITNLNNIVTNGLPIFNMIENYIYLYHIGQYIILPSYADSVTDSQPVSFSTTTPLSRSAPIYSYANSGPRSIQVAFDLHRDLMMQINKELNHIEGVTLDNDYVDLFIKYIQAATLPAYEVANKMVNPPIVALRLGNDIFIKGVITGSLGITYNYPILSDGRYAKVAINFSISEIDPYDANTVIRTGSFRNVSTTLDRGAVVITGDDGTDFYSQERRSVDKNTPGKHNI